jgi:hypothetical protein
MTQAAVQVYELGYHQNNESFEFFFALSEQAWSFGPWSSDARVLYCHLEKEKLAQLVVIGGTQVAWQGQPLLKAVGPSEFFEWRRRDAMHNAEPGEWSIMPWFEQLTSSSCPSSAGPNRLSSPYAEKR